MVINPQDNPAGWHYYFLFLNEEIETQGSLVTTPRFHNYFNTFSSVRTRSEIQILVCIQSSYFFHHSTRVFESLVHQCILGC